MSKTSEVKKLLRQYGLDDVLKAARALANNSECEDPQCRNKACVLTRAFAKFDKELKK